MNTQQKLRVEALKAATVIETNEKAISGNVYSTMQTFYDWLNNGKTIVREKIVEEKKH